MVPKQRDTQYAYVQKKQRDELTQWTVNTKYVFSIYNVTYTLHNNLYGHVLYVLDLSTYIARFIAGDFKSWKFHEFVYTRT